MNPQWRVVVLGLCMLLVAGCTEPAELFADGCADDLPRAIVTMGSCIGNSLAAGLIWAAVIISLCLPNSKR